MKFEKFAQIIAKSAKIWEPTGALGLDEDGNGVCVEVRFDQIEDWAVKEINKSVKGITIPAPGEYGSSWSAKITGAKIAPYGFGTKCLVVNGKKYYDAYDIVCDGKRLTQP